MEEVVAHASLRGGGDTWSRHGRVQAPSPVLSPLVVITHEDVGTVTKLLGGFYEPSDLRERCTALKYGLNEQVERG